MSRKAARPAELIEGYPRLTAEMIRLAPVYAAAYPLRGPPRKLPWRDQQPVRRGRRQARHHRGVVRFLIDECLSVDLVTVAGQSGHEAQHVAHVGRAGWKDWNVVRYARDGDFVLVTNNASDFRQLYATQPLHAGLVILIPVVSRMCSGACSRPRSTSWPYLASRSTACLRSISTAMR